MHIKEEQMGLVVGPTPIRFPTNVLHDPVGTAPKFVMPEGYVLLCATIEQITRGTWEHTYPLFECAGIWGLLVLEAAFTRAG